MSKSIILMCILGVMCVSQSSAQLFKDLLGLNKTNSASTSASPALGALSQDQVTSGLKEALGKGVEQVVAALGKEDGFLKDVNVKIPMPTV